jgi:hypothetical protein
VDLMSDDDNCGACDHDCDNGEDCLDGFCF